MLSDLSIEELKELNKDFSKKLFYPSLSSKDRKVLEECMFIVKDLINKKREGLKDAEGIFHKVSE